MVLNFILLTKSKFGFKVCFPRFTLFSAFYPLFRVLPSFPRFTLFSAFYPLFRVLPSFPRFTLFSAFYPLFRFRFSGSAISVPPVRSVPFPRFTPTMKYSEIFFVIRKFLAYTPPPPPPHPQLHMLATAMPLPRWHPAIALVLRAVDSSISSSIIKKIRK